MTTWYTSDQHLGNSNIIGYCNRPFRDSDHMDAEIVRRWNEVVAPGDHVYVLGDFAMGRIDNSLTLVKSLNGAKSLVPGNHDRVWTGYGYKPAKREAWFDKYHAAGVNVMAERFVLWVPPASATPHAGIVNVCHFPYSGDSHGEDRYLDHRPHDDGKWLLCGHVHDAWQVRGRQINVGVDVWDFYPVHEETIADIILEGES